MRTHQETLAAISAQRAREMRSLRKRGWTLVAIGEKYGISKQRVGQIVAGTPRNVSP